MVPPPVASDLVGVLVDGGGVLGEGLAAGGHHGDIAIGDPFGGGASERAGGVFGSQVQRGGE